MRIRRTGPVQAARSIGEVGSGVVVIDKPSGWTSHQAVARVRRLLGTRKVGHAGTLDPMATGVLVVGVNRATRLLGHLMLTEKAYAATIRLGIATVTDDAEGEVSGRTGVLDLDNTRLEAALAPLRGDILQVPTAVSAIKVNGVRAYAKVRAGEPVELAARPVRVSRLEVRSRTDRVVDGVAVVDLDVLVECSSGTYVRALARDLGAALGVGGHLTALRRTAVGDFGLGEAQALDDADTGLKVIGLYAVARRCFPGVELSADQAAAVRVGRRLPDLVLTASPSAVFAPSGEFLALYRSGEGEAVPVAVLCSG
jgi:tRNA pseudouridine55 synthase